MDLATWLSSIQHQLVTLPDLTPSYAKCHLIIFSSTSASWGPKEKAWEKGLLEFCFIWYSSSQERIVFPQGWISAPFPFIWKMRIRALLVLCRSQEGWTCLSLSFTWDPKGHGPLKTLNLSINVLKVSCLRDYRPWRLESQGWVGVVVLSQSKGNEALVRYLSPIRPDLIPLVISEEFLRRTCDFILTAYFPFLILGHDFDFGDGYLPLQVTFRVSECLHTSWN